MFDFSLWFAELWKDVVAEMRKSILNAFVELFPKRYIVFESKPDYADNTLAVFNEMIKRGVNKKYKLVWILYSDKIPENAIRDKNIYYATPNSKQRKIAITFARCIITCNGFLHSTLNKAPNFFLSHGLYVKCPTSYYTVPDYVDYCFSPSKDLEEIQAKALDIPRSKMVSLGFPRNDVLSNPPKINLHNYFDVEYKKLIVWYPTFRKHTSGMKTGSVHTFPIIWNDQAAIKINQAAKEHQVLIVLKPHFAQDISQLQSLNLSNIVLIDDTFFSQHRITSYEFLANTDAMLSDYSSVYFDYVLCNKPIGLIWEDYTEYERNPGFALDMQYYMKGGEKIYTDDDLCEFIKNVANSNDTLYNERNEIKKISNYSSDGKSTKRVVDFILEKSHI